MNLFIPLGAVALVALIIVFGVIWLLGEGYS